VLAGMKMIMNLGPAYIAEFNAIYPALAKKHEVAFMPFFLEGVATKRELNQDDGIHPVAAGYDIIVENILPPVGAAIEKITKQRQEK
jgi:acyl-CoA thioesterase-1